MDCPGPAPPYPEPLLQGIGPGLQKGEGEVTAASSGPVISGVWDGLSSPPQPHNFSGLFLPFSPAEPGARAPLMWEGPLCLKWAAAKTWGWHEGMPLARPGLLSNCSDGL